MSAPFASRDETSTAPAGAAPNGSRAARLAVLAILAWLAWSAFHDELGYLPLLGDIDLAIHEAGHIVFMPFGRTMMILGGSLFQVAFPLVFAAYFLWPRFTYRARDVYASMICVWWSALNLLSVAIYCGDSRAGRLILLDGSTAQDGDSHDWKNLLKIWNALDQDTIIARRMRAVAVLMCCGSLIVAAWSVFGRDARAGESADAMSSPSTTPATPA